MFPPQDCDDIGQDRGLPATGIGGCVGIAMQEPHLVEAQLRLITLILVCLPFWLVGCLTAVGGLVRLALGQAAARVCVRELRVPLLDSAAAAGNRDGQHKALPDQELDGVVQADVVVKQCVAVLHLQGRRPRSPGKGAHGGECGG